MLTDSGVVGRSVQLDYDDEETTHQAVQEICDSARREDGRRNFLQVSYTHMIPICVASGIGIYENIDIPAPRTGMLSGDDADAHGRRILAQHGFDNADASDDDIAKARRAYCWSVSFIDAQLEQLMAALEESGQKDNTVVIFTSDHGEMLGERGLWLKKTFFEPSLRVPMIISAPHRMTSGRVTTPASLVDLLPTFMALATEAGWSGGC